VLDLESAYAKMEEEMQKNAKNVKEKDKINERIK